MWLLVARGFSASRLAFAGFEHGLAIGDDGGLETLRQSRKKGGCPVGVESATVGRASGRFRPARAAKGPPRGFGCL
jgi:hypothetical protein